jgi:hypothetical protein
VTAASDADPFGPDEGGRAESTEEHLEGVEVG